MAKQYKGKNYTFQKTEYENLKKNEGSHNIMNLYLDIEQLRASRWNNFSDLDGSIFHSIYVGQLKTLFGEPDQLTEDYENLVTYAVEAQHEDGTVLYLDVYFGPSGPAIGAPDGEEYMQAALELEQIIMDAELTDYSYKCVYEDFDVEIEMGVEEGKPYFREIMPEGFDIDNIEDYL